MALIECVECNRQHSDTIESCPHCGYRRADHVKEDGEEKSKSEISTETDITESESKKSSYGGVLMILLMGIVVLSIYYLNKKEESLSSTTVNKTNKVETPPPKIYRYVYKTVNMRKGPGTSYDIIRSLRHGIKIEFISNEGDWSRVATLRDTGFVHNDFIGIDPLPDVQIVDWSWSTDPGFGTEGAVIWLVELRNNSSTYIEMVKVEITIYDAQGRVTDSDFTYVSGLAPGGTASKKSYATWYGTEQKARIRIAD